MSIISSALRAAVQRVRDRTFTTTIEVLVKNSVPNGAGGETVTWPTAATYSGRLRHARPMDYLLIKGAEPMSTGIWLAMLPVGSAIDTTNRIRAGGRIFSVLSTDAGRSDPLVLTVHCMPLAELS